MIERDLALCDARSSRRSRASNDSGRDRQHILGELVEDPTYGAASANPGCASKGEPARSVSRHSATWQGDPRSVPISFKPPVNGDTHVNVHNVQHNQMRVDQVGIDPSVAAKTALAFGNALHTVAAKAADDARAETRQEAERLFAANQQALASHALLQHSRVVNEMSAERDRTEACIRANAAEHLKQHFSMISIIFCHK